MRKTVLILGPVGLGAVVAVLAAVGARGGDRRAARLEAPSSRAGSRISPAPAPQTPAAQRGSPAEIAPGGGAPLSDPAGASPEGSLIESRVRVMEQRLRELQARRDDLASSNRDLEKEIGQKNAEATAKVMAEMRVRGWEASLGLTELQKQSLLELCTHWTREDAGRSADLATWEQREAELRSRLTAEQSGKLHDLAVAQGVAQWAAMGRYLGQLAGFAKDDQVRLQQSLGDVNLPNSLLLPEAHGADWSGLLRDAAARARPLFTPEQTARIQKLVGGF